MYIALSSFNYRKHISSENPKKCINQRKHIHNNFLSEVFRTIKIQNFNHQNLSDFFV